MRDFSRCQRIVIKAGTSILTASSGRFSVSKLARLSAQVLEVMKKRKEIVLVSSGAIGFGMDAMNLKKRPREMAMLQACAAIGQGKLIHAYEKYFSARGVHTAQILLTRDALELKDRFLKARRTFKKLLGRKALPIVNENDTVSTDEIRFGDNDILSVQVAHLVHADLLIILSDVDGFFLRDGSRVREVTSEQEIDGELVKHLHGKKGEKTTGGMKSKLESAKVAMRLGLPLLILNGHGTHEVLRALKGEDVGTFFSPVEKGKSSRIKRVAFSAVGRGK